MGNQALMDAVGQLKKDVGDLIKLSLPKGEAEDRFKKLETDFGELQNSLKEQRLRLSALPGVDVGGGGGHYLAKNGFTSVCAAQRMKVYATNPRTGQMINSVMVPEDVIQTLKTMDDVYLVHCLLMTSPKTRHDWREAILRDGQRNAFLKSFPELGRQHDASIKAMAEAQGKTVEDFNLKTLTTSGVGTGAEWIPTQFSSMLMDEIRLDTPEANLIPHFMQPRDNFTFPILNTVGKAYRKIENVNVTGSNIGTAKRLWAAHVHAAYHDLTDEIDQDSIVAVVPALRFSLIRCLSEGMAMSIVNGDGDAANHIDDDYATATAPYFTYQGGINGLRQFALDPQGSGTASTFGGGADYLSFQDIADSLAIMGKFAAKRVGDNALLVNAESWLKLLGEADSPIVTLDKYGSQATILTGEMARIFNVPIFPSYAVEQRKDVVGATGVVTGGSGDSLSTAVLFNRMNFKIGDLRDFRVETDRNIIAMRDDLVASMRISMNAVEGDVSDSNWDPQGTPAVVAIVNIN